MKKMFKKTVNHRGFTIVVSLLPNAQHCPWEATVNTGLTVGTRSVSHGGKSLKRVIHHARSTVDDFLRTGSWDNGE